MADKGFNIADLLETKGITLNIPPRKKEEQFDNTKLIEIRRIASLRVHIERAFGRVKIFKILSSIPNNMAESSTEIFITCALLTFNHPLSLINNIMACNNSFIVVILYDIQIMAQLHNYYLERTQVKLP